MSRKIDAPQAGGSSPGDYGSLRAASHLLAMVERVGMVGAGVCFAAIVAITAVDVAMRYVFSAPLVWAYELIADYLMVAVFFLSIAVTQHAGQNIGVDLLVRRLPGRVRAALAAACQMLALGLFILIVCVNWSEMIEAWSGGDVIAGAIPWPRWPMLALLVVGCGMLVARLGIECAGNLVAALSGALHMASHEQPRAAPAFGGE